MTLTPKSLADIDIPLSSAPAVSLHVGNPATKVSGTLLDLRRAAAIEPLQRVSGRFVNERDARVLLATALLYAGRFDEADAVASVVSEQDDKMRGTLLGLRARCAQGRADETAARTLYREALLYAPHSEWMR